MIIRLLVKTFTLKPDAVLYFQNTQTNLHKYLIQGKNCEFALVATFFEIVSHRKFVKLIHTPVLRSTLKFFSRKNL